MYDGLVLSGGAARGAAFLGALDRLRQVGDLDDLKVVSGTSIGSLAAVLAAKRADMREVLAAIAERPFQLHVNLLAMDKGFGLDAGLGLLAFVRSLIGRQSFEELEKETGVAVVVCATSLADRRPVYFGPRTHASMEVASAVRLSCSLPFLFNYGVWEESAFVDGGLADNFPTSGLGGFACRRVLGLRFRSPEPTARPASLTDYVISLMACVAWQAEPKDHLCARVIELDVEPAAALDFSMSAPELNKLFDIGRNSV